MKIVSIKITIILLLTTNLLAISIDEFLSSNKYKICLTDYKLSDMLQAKNEDFCSYDKMKQYINSKAIFDSAEDIYPRMFGNLTEESFISSGIKSNLKKSYGHFSLAFEEFLCYLNTYEKRAIITKFFIITKKTEFKKDKLTHFLYANFIAGNASQPYYTSKFRPIYETTEFIGLTVSNKIYEQYEKEKIMRFVQYVIDKDFEKALEYAKITNESYSYNNLQEIVNVSCSKPNIKNISQVYEEAENKLK